MCLGHLPWVLVLPGPSYCVVLLEKCSALLAALLLGEVLLMACYCALMCITAASAQIID